MKTVLNIIENGYGFGKQLSILSFAAMVTSLPKDFAAQGHQIANTITHFPEGSIFMCPPRKQ